MKKSLKILAWIMFVLGFIAAAILIFLWFTPKETIHDLFEKKEVESIWYSNYPVENTIVFYKDGTYTSEQWGSLEGCYRIVRNNGVLTDEYHSEQHIEINEHEMKLIDRGEPIMYYDSKDLLPEQKMNSEEYELLCKRKTAVAKIIDQAIWKNKAGHQLSGTMKEITLDGTTSPYTVEELTMQSTRYEVVLQIGERHCDIQIDVNMNTMEYTLYWDNMVFTADGTDFDLDC